MNAFYNKKIAQQLLYVVGGLLLCVQAWAVDPVSQSQEAAISGVTSTTKGYDLLAGDIKYSVQDIVGPLPFIRDYQATLRNNVGKAQEDYFDRYLTAGSWTNNYTNAVQEFPQPDGRLLLGLRLPGSRSTLWMIRWPNGVWGRLISTAGLYYSAQGASVTFQVGLYANMSMTNQAGGGYIFKYKGVEYQTTKTKMLFTGGLRNYYRIAKVIYPDSKVMNFTYDTQLNPLGVSDSFGNKLTFELQVTDLSHISNISKVTFTTASGVVSQTASYAYGSYASENFSQQTVNTYYITSATSTMGGTQSYGYTAINQPGTALYLRVNGQTPGNNKANVLTQVKDQSGVVQQQWDVTSNYVFAADGKSYSTEQLTLRAYRPITVRYGIGGIGPVDDFTTVYDDKARTMTLTTKPDGTNSTTVIYTANNTIVNRINPNSQESYVDDSAFSIVRSSGDYPGLLIGGKPLQSVQMNTWFNYITEAYDRRGTKAVQIADDLSRVTSQTITPAEGGTGRIVTYTYGGLSNGATNIFDTPTLISQNNGTYTTTDTRTINSVGQTTQRVLNSTQSGSISKTYTYTYTSLGQPLKTTGPRSTQSNSGVDDSITYSYYSNGDLKDETRWRTKPNGTKLARVTQYSYNSAGQPVFIGYENQDSVVYTYDSRFRKTKAEYGPRNSSLGLASVLGSQTWTYDVLNQVTQSCDEDSVCTDKNVYSYDSLGRLVAKAIVGGETVAYEYWPNGVLKRESVSYGNKSIQQTTLNSLGQISRLTRGTDLAKNYVDHTYDLHGNVLSKKTAMGIVNSWTYDGFDRMLTHTDGKGYVETKTYDLADNLLKNTDPLGQEFNYTYNSGKQKGYSSTNGLIATTVVRDAADNILSATSPTRSCTVAGYNEESSPWARDCQTGGQEYKRVNETYTYADVGGELTSVDQSYTGSMAGEGVKTNYNYDVSHRLIGKLQLNKTIGKLGLATTKSLVNGYAYTAAGRLSAIAYPSGMRVSYVYDAAGRVSGVYYGQATMSPVISDLKYYADRVQSWLWTDSTTVSQSFIYQDDLTTLRSIYYYTRPAVSVVQGIYQSGVDADGRPQTITQVCCVENNNPSTAHFTSASSAFDGNNRVLGSQAESMHNSYTYDNNGNRLVKKLGSNIKATYGYTGNRLSSWTEAGANKPLEYKTDEGIVYEPVITTPEYDGAGRRRVDTNNTTGAVTWYEYNHKNERTYKRTAGQAGRQFMYDGGRLIGEYDDAGNAINEYGAVVDKVKFVTIF